MTISNYLEDRILNNVLTTSTAPPVSTTAVFASVHTADPGETGTGSPLASCARFPVTFNVAASATSVLAAAASVVTSASGTITHLALWDGSDTGTANCLWYGPIVDSNGSATSKAVNAGDTINIASGNLRVSLD